MNNAVPLYMRINTLHERKFTFFDEVEGEKVNSNSDFIGKSFSNINIPFPFEDFLIENRKNR